MDKDSDFTFQVNENIVEKSNLLKDLKSEINLGLDEEDILDTEYDVNFFKGFELKNSENLKAISEFILKYLDNINKNQEIYDELTNKRIKTEIANLNQKTIERTLKSMKLLSEEGNEEKKMLLFINMRVFKKINYANIAEHVDNLFENENAEIYDNIDTYDENVVLDTDAIGDNEDIDGINNNYNEDNENMVYNIISRDDDEGDQDYEGQAVDDD